MSFSLSVESLKPVLQKRIEKYTKTRSGEYPSVQFYADTLERIAKISVSGKMLRGLFIPTTYSFFATDGIPDRVMDAAAAIELMQTALLIHDDIIDEDTERRGQRAIHAQYADDAVAHSLEHTDRYGKSMGICAGDIAIFLAYDLLASAVSGTAMSSRIVSMFSREFHLVGIGEMIDVDFAFSKNEPDEKSILDMYRYKTARYSFSLPFAMGALLAGAPEQIINDLYAIGENLGIIFQIRDDELGLSGDSAATGKPVGADIRENKKTLHRALLYQTVPVEVREQLNGLFGKASLSSQEVSTVMGLMHTYHIAELAAAMSKTMETQTAKLIDTMNLPLPNKKTLLEIMTLIMNRDR